jgi:DNA repair protein RecO (recombination protein O)
MPSVRDEAIVLRLSDYSESSQIVTLFGAVHGQVRLIAKGARRSTKTRVAPGFDLLEQGDVQFIPAHGDAQLAILTDWAQRDAFAGLRRELLRLYGGLYAAELVVALTEEHDPHPALYEALLALLRGLNDLPHPAPQIPTFQAALLDAIGYAPDLTGCVSCRRPVPADSPAFFSARAGGLLCRDCEMHHTEKWRPPPGVLRTTPATGNPLSWFELFDYHLTQTAGRPFKTAAHVKAALARRLPSGV